MATVSYTHYTHILYTPFSRDQKREYYNICIHICRRRETKRRENHGGRRGKNPLQREKGGTEREKRRV